MDEGDTVTKNSHFGDGRNWTSLRSLEYGRSSLTSGYLTFYEEREAPHWKQRIEKVRKYSLCRCPWSPKESHTSEHARVITKRLGQLMIVCPKSPWEGLRSPGLHPCWLAGLLRAFLPSFPASLLCLRLLPASRCSRLWSSILSVPRRALGTSRSFAAAAAAGTAAWSRGLIAHLVLPWLARQAIGGALHTTPASCGAPVSSRGLRTWSQSPSGGPGASWSRPRVQGMPWSQGTHPGCTCPHQYREQV